MTDAAESPDAPERAAEREEFHRAVERHQKRNFNGLLLQNVAQRQGWFFRPESLVISTLALGLGALESVLGLFPFISRIGKFLPQVIAGRAMEPLKRKRGAVLWSASLIFALLWLLLGVVLALWGRRAKWALWFFFGFYAVPWFAIGVAILGLGTLRGKLIRPNLRGSLYGRSQIIGGVLVIPMIFIFRDIVCSDNGIIPGLLGIEGTADEGLVVRYGLSFVLAGFFFLLTFGSLFILKEPPLSSGLKGAQPVGEFVRSAWALLRDNPDYRRAVAIRFLLNVLFSCLMFYASFGRKCIGPAMFLKMIGALLLVQTCARSICAMVVGWFADRIGNRAVMRVLSVALVIWPLMGVYLSNYATPETPWYWAPVYLMVGAVIPLEMMAQNYILEVTPIERHASSLGVANALLLGVAVVPLIVGPAIAAYGHEAVFTGLGVLMLPAIYFSMRLGEPRFEVEPRKEPPPLA